MKLRKRRKKERISKSAIKHSSLGDLRKNNGKWRLHGGGHGRENLRKLKKYEIDYKINETYKNGVRVGDILWHKHKNKRKGSNHSWFPLTWTRSTIKRAGEKTINSIPYKLPDGRITFGKYRSVKVGVIRTYGKVATVFPDKFQQTSVRKKRKKKLPNKRKN